MALACFVALASVQTSLFDLAATLTSQIALRSRARLGERVKIRGRIRVAGGGEILVGDDVELDGRLAPIELHARRGGTIVLGRGVRVDGGVSIEAKSRVEVGARTVLHGFCKLLDNHFHPVSGDRHRGAPPSKPVVIGSDCDLGWRALILPGARIGDGARALPGVVVSRRVPAGAVIGGSPPALFKCTETR
jgi:acetyltransferase-like isoleucine patch superfamily enzyme